MIMISHHYFSFFVIPLLILAPFRVQGSPGNNDDQDTNRGLMVVQGSTATKGSNPYFVDMGGCGGTLISPDYVLFAAHCGSRQGAAVMVGTYFRNPDVSNYGMRFAEACQRESWDYASFLECKAARMKAFLEYFNANAEILPPITNFGLFNFFSSFDVSTGTFVKQDQMPSVHLCTQYIEHPEYSGGDIPPHFNDFALCKLDRPAEIDSSTYSLKLNTNPDFPSPGTEVSVIGFGFTSVASNSGVLQEGKINVISDDDCSKILLNDPVALCDPPFDDFEFNPIDGTGPSVICAGKLQNASDKQNVNGCVGDSGGPLYVREYHHSGDDDAVGASFTDILVGVVSWGRRCGVGPEPGMYARVSSGIDFLREIICDNETDIEVRMRSESFCSGGSLYGGGSRKSRKLEPTATNNEFDQCPFDESSVNDDSLDPQGADDFIENIPMAPSTSPKIKSKKGKQSKSS